MSHSSKQQAINNVQLENRVMGLLVQHQRLTDAGSVEDGLVWTTEAIAAHLHYDDLEGVWLALRHLLGKDWVERRNNEWVKTEAGEALYRDEVKRPALSLSTHAFKIEALTGMTAAGNQSPLTRAALHGKEERHQCNEDTLITQCSFVGEIRAIAAQFGLPPKDTQQLLLSGEIHICYGTDGESPHWGRYHAHNGSDGKKWQYRCIKCMRAMRKARKQHEQNDR